MAVHSNTLHCHAESGWGDRANASATPRHLRFGSPTSMCTWRVTRSTDGWRCTRLRTPGALASDNLVVDRTWDEGTEYFGVPFRHDYLSRVLKARRDYGLIDNTEMDFPLVTGAHPVDEAVINCRDASAS